MGAAKDISVDAAILTLFPQVDGIFKMKDQKTALNDLPSAQHCLMLLHAGFSKYSVSQRVAARHGMEMHGNKFDS